MNKNAILALMIGVLSAGLICLAVGLTVYFTAHGNAISVIVGMFTIAIGGVMSAVAALILIIIVIINAIQKNKKD